MNDLKINIDDRHVSRSEYLDINQIPDSHKHSFQKGIESYQHEWVDIDSHNVEFSSGFIMCFGLLALKDDSFTFTHSLISEMFKLDLELFAESVKREILKKNIKKIILFRQLSNYFSNNADLDLSRDSNNSIMSTEFISHINIFNDELGDFADKNGVEVLIKEIRLTSNSDTFAITIGEGKVVVWDQILKLPVIMYDLKDLTN